MTVPKVAYLTIDDAPSADMQQKVDFLAENQIPVVWFCIGNSLAQRPDLVVYAIEKGGVIGNHTYTHPHCSALELDDIYDQIRRTDTLIDGIYRQAGKDRPAKYFRFPYGDKGVSAAEFSPRYSGEALQRKEAIQAFLRAEGFTPPPFAGITYAAFRRADQANDVDWLWTYDCMDWALHGLQSPNGMTSLEMLFARMEADAPDEGRGLNTPGSEEIILVHDHAETTPYFPSIIQRLLGKGIMFRRPL